MRKIAILAALVCILMTRPAEARCQLGTCPGWVDAFSYMFIAAVVGGYGVGTGYFVYRDVTDERQSLKYGAAELGYNGAFGALWTAAAIDDLVKGNIDGGTLFYGAAGAIHTTLAVHGAWRVHQQWDEIDLPDGRMPKDTGKWIAGIAYGANTLVWTAMLPGRHGRTYGIVEASVNGPLALGLAYLAVDNMRDRDRGPALIYGGLAAISGALTYHGIRRAIEPDEPAGIDLLGTDVMPVAVSDGHETAPGLAMSGSW